MNNHKQGFIVTILIILIAILAISAGLYLYQTNNQSAKAPIDIQTTNATQTNNTPNSKIYSNSQYGFQFSYPSTFSTLQEYPNNRQQECVRTEAGKGTSINAVGIVSFNDGMLSVDVVCQPLTQDVVTSGINTFNETTEADNINTIIVAGIMSYRHNFTTAVGYQWIIIQIPLDANHYIEIGYTFGNSNRLQGETPLSNTEWAQLLASFKITK